MEVPDREIVATSYRSIIGSLSHRLAASKGPPRHPVAIAACIGLVPFLVASLWFAVRVRAIHPDAIQVLVLGSAILWILLAPILMTWGQTWVEALLISARADAAETHLDLGGLMRRLQWVDKSAALVSVTFALVFAASFLVLRNQIERYLGITFGAFEIAIGLLLFSFVGLTSGEGAWGVLKTVALENGVTAIEWPWYPFEPWPIDTLKKLGRSSYATALIFSAGSLFLPMTLALYAASTTIASRVAAIIAVVVLGLGSSTLFVYPYLKLHFLEQRQRQNALRVIGAELELYLPATLRRGAASATPGASDHLDGLLRLWTRIKEEPVSPTATLTVFMGRLTSTLIVPLLVATLSALALR